MFIKYNIKTKISNINNKKFNINNKKISQKDFLNIFTLKNEKITIIKKTTKIYLKKVKNKKVFYKNKK